MEKVLEIQKKAFLKEGPPSLEMRKDLLRRCAALIETYEEKIIKALNHDFQKHGIPFQLVFLKSVKSIKRTINIFIFFIIN